MRISSLTSCMGLVCVYVKIHSLITFGFRLGRFWLRDSRLMVRGVIDHTVQMNGKSVALTEKEQAEEAVNQYALEQLQKYGFHKTRCSQALRNCNGDYGLALQTLMSDCFSLGLQSPFAEDKCDSNEEFGDCLLYTSDAADE